MTFICFLPTYKAGVRRYSIFPRIWSITYFLFSITLLICKQSAYAWRLPAYILFSTKLEASHFLNNTMQVHAEILTSISCLHILHAAPKPTARGHGTVPLLKPRSWPPPLMIGSRRTLGRLRTYRAPTPVKK
jgi:hypothetical protein